MRIIFLILGSMCFVESSPAANQSTSSTGSILLPQCDNQCAKTCKVSGTSWHMKCGWSTVATFSKDGQSITNTSALTASGMTIRRKVRHDGDLQILEVLNLQASTHSGEYRCRGVNELRTLFWTRCECLVVTSGQQEQQQCLQAIRPKISPPGPRNVRGFEGQPSLVLDCFSTGGATHLRRWLFNSSPISSASQWSPTYVLRNVTRSMAGQYTCELLEKHRREYYDRVDYFVTIQQDTRKRNINKVINETSLVTRRLTCPYATMPWALNQSVQWSQDGTPLNSSTIGVFFARTSVIIVDLRLLDFARRTTISCRMSETNVEALFNIIMVPPDAPRKPHARPGNKIVAIQQDHEPTTKLIVISTFRQGRMSMAMSHLVERFESKADPKQELTPSEACFMASQDSTVSLAIELQYITRDGIRSSKSEPENWNYHPSLTKTHLHTFLLLMKANENGCNSNSSSATNTLSVTEFSRLWHQRLTDIFSKLCSCCSLEKPLAMQLDETTEDVCTTFSHPHDVIPLMNCTAAGGALVEVKFAVRSTTELTNLAAPLHRFLRAFPVLSLNDDWEFSYQGFWVYGPYWEAFSLGNLTTLTETAVSVSMQFTTSLCAFSSQLTYIAHAEHTSMITSETMVTSNATEYITSSGPATTHTPVSSLYLSPTKSSADVMLSLSAINYLVVTVSVLNILAMSV
ncbi:uncharacterized protein LOC135811987 isoform X2 [Sycon ciliatum]|uniref:uncharacterized protein LOC135811984 isoform X2 n=1 Tax=Sycon ciliatum TaxID=27933 RepID=UPI0031F6967B